MIEIYESGSGGGIGHGLQDFMDRFDQICRDHIKDKRAKSFAFIFYNFGDKNLQKVLRNRGVFAKLNDLSGDEVSVFTLHARSAHAVEAFNLMFLSVLGVPDTKPPCVVFFKLVDNQIGDVQVVTLDSPDLVHSLDELKSILGDYLKAEKEATGRSEKYWKFSRGVGKFVAIEAVKEGIKAIFF